jgi:hypothetical protein
LGPLYGDACSAKSFEVLTLVFSTDCSPIGWIQSVLRITRFENIFLFFLFFENQQASRSRGGEIGRREMEAGGRRRTFDPGKRR